MSSLPISPISRQINRLLYASSVLSLGILACSLVFLGSTSLWLSEAGIFLAIIHHSGIAFDRVQHKNLRQRGASPLPLPLSARKPMIFLAVVISAVYTAAFAVNLMFIIFELNGSLEIEWQNRWIATIIEAVCLLFEAPLMLTIALWSMKERRAMLGDTGEGKWYHLPQYRNRKCKGQILSIRPRADRGELAKDVAHAII